MKMFVSMRRRKYGMKSGIGQEFNGGGRREAQIFPARQVPGAFHQTASQNTMFGRKQTQSHPIRTGLLIRVPLAASVESFERLLAVPQRAAKEVDHQMLGFRLSANIVASAWFAY
jgi:hypothetical protein